MTTHSSQAARSHVDTTRDKADLARLGARAAAGQVEPFHGLHGYLPEHAERFRPATVLLLFVPTWREASPEPGHSVDLYFVKRSEQLRHHPGEIGFPGGKIEDFDDGVQAAALREMNEEIGLDPAGIEILGELPPLALPITEFMVTPVLGWADRSDLEPVGDGSEILHPMRLAMSHLLDPTNRAVVESEHSKWATAAFQSRNGWVWGFTGNLLDYTLDALGWTIPWRDKITTRLSFRDVASRR